MTTKEKEKTLSDLFDDWQKRPDSPALSDLENFKARVLAVFAEDEARQRSDRNAFDVMNSALKHTMKAIKVLEDVHAKGYSNRQSRRLLELLGEAYNGAGAKDKGERHISHYHADSDSWVDSVLTATSKKKRSATARLIFNLENLWFSEFKERPNNADEPKFYIFAGDMMGIDPSSVKKQRERTVPPVQTDRG